MATADISLDEGGKVGRERVPLASWWALFVLFLMYVLAYTDRYLITMLVDPIQADLGISDLEMGFILGPAFGIAIGLFGLPCGWLADRYPRRWVIFVGAAIWSVATAACGVATSAAMLLAARIGVGVGEASLSPSAASILSDKFPRHRLTLAIAIYQSGVKVGSAVAFALGGILIGATSSMDFSVPGVGQLAPWHLVFILVGLPGLLISLLVFTFSEPKRKGRIMKGKVPATMVVGFLRENAVLMVLLFGGFTFVSLCSFSLASWVPTYISRRWELAPEVYGPALGLINLLAGAALLFKGTFVDWLYSRGMKDAQVRFYSWLLICTIPVIAGIFFVPDPWIFMVIYGGLQIVVIPSMMYLATTLPLITPGEVKSQVLALGYTLYTLVGLTIGPTVVGFLTDVVFQDPQQIGMSLAIVCGTSIPMAALFLRLSLRPLNKALYAAEQTWNSED